jgi:putative endonuclease
MAAHNDLGKHGEDLAVDLLVKKGYRILERNWRHRKAEIDILATKDDVLAVVEVKTRSSNFYGNPEDFVTAKKIQLLVLAADEYVQKKRLTQEVRFDVIRVLLDGNGQNLRHLERAFLHF